MILHSPQRRGNMHFRILCNLIVLVASLNYVNDLDENSRPSRVSDKWSTLNVIHYPLYSPVMLSPLFVKVCACVYHFIGNIIS